MKKNLVLRIGALALAGCCITMTMLSGTFAKYTSEIKGAATATVAKWSFKTDGVEKDGIVTYSLTTGDVKIAPGKSGNFKITLDGSGSDTDIDYAISVKQASLGDGVSLPTTFKISSTAEGLETREGEFIVKGTIPYDATAENMKKEIVFDWEWPYEMKDGDAEAIQNANLADTTFAENVAKESISLYDITITGTQVAPPTESPASAN